ncbi:MAG: helix-turn-helix transcriptional regulator [Dehalococcoidia bacterium]|nr:helix-turn-helix transcriptional regulator [Dehalococcoidia bacterium]
MDRDTWFDSTAFYAALDGERVARNMTWRKVSLQSGVSASTLTRIAQGKRPDVDSLASLASWAALDIDEFVRSRREEARPASRKPTPLAMISTYLRADPNLSPEAAAALDAVVKAAYEKLKNSEA